MANTKENKRTIYIVIGNGFSIDIIEKIGKSQDIDLINLFSKSDLVPWPDKKIECFLSKKHCPELWLLGARATVSKEKALSLIDDIITSMNAYYLYDKDSDRTMETKRSPYYLAYCQLVSYLKNLFIYYNSRISDDELREYIGRKIGFIEYIIKIISKNNKLRIITYNYDILLERILTLCNIEYKIAGFDSFSITDSLVIFKPHGSISFVSKLKRDKSQSYNIIKDPNDSMNMKIDEMEIDMRIENDISNINPIIPPAGDANRVPDGWSVDINEKLRECIKNSKSEDELIIYGISYGHVDRNEIDKIITTLPYKIDVKYINPYPSSTFDMVLGSIFENYSHYKDFYLEV